MLHFLRSGVTPVAALPIAGVNGSDELTILRVDATGKLEANISASLSGADGAITDGVTASIRATVIESTANPGTFGLVVLGSDGSDLGGGSGGGGAVTVADGADVTAGAKADAKVTGDTSGSLSAKLRGLNYLLALATDTANSRINVFLQNSSITAVAGASSTGTITSVSAATSSTSLLGSNASRLGATFYNDSTAIARIALAGSASTTSFTKALMPGEFFTLPMRYTGAIFCIWESATGSMRITELT